MNVPTATLLYPDLCWDEYRLTCQRDAVDVQAVHRFLSTTYWSPDLPIQVLERAVQHSLCFSLLEEVHPEKDRLPSQIGFARVVSDRATFAYLCDVYVLETHRGKGLSKRMLGYIQQHPQLQHLRRFLLATRDAHGLYTQCGFQPLAKPDSFMEIYHPLAHLDAVPPENTTG